MRDVIESKSVGEAAAAGVKSLVKTNNKKRRRDNLTQLLFQKFDDGVNKTIYHNDTRVNRRV